MLQCFKILLVLLNQKDLVFKNYTDYKLLSSSVHNVLYENKFTVLQYLKPDG